MEQATTTAKTRRRPLHVGIDFGGVLSIHDGGHVTSREHRSVQINMPGAVEALYQLREREHTLSIVSFCGKARAVETNAALVRAFPQGVFHQRFFVKDRFHKKHIVHHAGCDVLVDDTFDILQDVLDDADNHCRHVVWFRGDPSAAAASASDPAAASSSSSPSLPPGMWIAETWDDVVRVCEQIASSLHDSSVSAAETSRQSRRARDLQQAQFALHALDHHAP